MGKQKGIIGVTCEGYRNANGKFNFRIVEESNLGKTALVSTRQAYTNKKDMESVAFGFTEYKGVKIQYVFLKKYYRLS